MEEALGENIQLSPMKRLKNNARRALDSDTLRKDFEDVDFELEDDALEILDAQLESREKWEMEQERLRKLQPEFEPYVRKRINSPYNVQFENEVQSATYLYDALWKEGMEVIFVLYTSACARFTHNLHYYHTTARDYRRDPTTSGRQIQTAVNREERT